MAALGSGGYRRLDAQGTEAGVLEGPSWIRTGLVLDSP